MVEPVPNEDFVVVLPKPPNPPNPPPVDVFATAAKPLVGFAELNPPKDDWTGLDPRAANPLWAGSALPGDANEDSLLPAAAPNGEDPPGEAAANGEVALARDPKPDFLKASFEVWGRSFPNVPVAFDVCGIEFMVAKGEVEEVFEKPLPGGIYIHVSSELRLQSVFQTLDLLSAVCVLSDPAVSLGRLVVRSSSASEAAADSLVDSASWERTASAPASA